VIVQQLASTATPDAPRFVIAQLEHSRLAGRFAEAWGNHTFAPLEPHELMVQLAIDHDRGWDVVDDELGCDPSTGLPWNLVRTPLPALVRSSRRGPDLNEATHPLLGLLSSMHTWGLFHGRYGLSDKIFVDLVPAEHRGAVDEMLAHERARQARLRARLAGDPESAVWVEEVRLFHNYKLLQFFDTLALYFNCTAPADRRVATFPSVPVEVGADVTITVRPLGPGRYQVTPYPFAAAPLVVTCAGRWLRPHDDLEPAAGARAFANAPGDLETITLVPASAGDA
jgi:hypothetical protein